MSILELKNIHKSFNGHKVLDGIDLYVEKGEIVGLLGVSGSGKTTVFNIIAGTIKADQGRVYHYDEDITNTMGNVSYMLQKDLLFPHFTIIENAILPLLLRGVDKQKAVEKAGKSFETFGLSGTENKYPRQLSGGMRQRAALLRTYMNEKDLILLDEPFSALDMITKSSMHNWFLDISKKLELSGIFISHDIDEAIYLSDRIYILNTHGKIQKELTIDRQGLSGDDFKLSEEFLAYKKIIIKNIK